MRQNGQVAIVVLLISAIVMTIGLSVSKRTVVETKIDTSEEQLKQAFNTAESGIQYYLNTTKVGYTASDNSQANVSVDKNVGVGTTINLGGITLNNKTQFFWLVGHNGNGSINYDNKYGGTTLDLCVGVGFTGALKIDYFYKKGNDYFVWRSGYNVVTDNVVQNYPLVNPVPGGCIAEMVKISVANIPLDPINNIPLLLAVRPIGAGTKIILQGNNAQEFPSQGEEITSTGTVGNNVSQVVKVFNQYWVPVFMIDGITADSVLSN